MAVYKIGSYKYISESDEFCCPECGFRTIDEDEIIKHMKEEHHK